MLRLPLYNNPHAMIDFVLYNLGYPTFKETRPTPKLCVVIAQAYRLITLRFAFATKRQTAFFRIVSARFLDDLRVIHDVFDAFIGDGNDTLSYADHIRRKPDACVFVGA